MGDKKIVILIADKIYANYSGDLRFEGETPVPTQLRDWKEIKGYSLIEEKQRDTHINKGWKLKAGFTPSDLAPAILLERPDEDIVGLYSIEYETIMGEWVPIFPEIEVMQEDKDFTIYRPNFTANHFLLDKIKYDSVELINKPVFISSQNLYDIVRATIKQKIDGRYARITSDYDFCFTVQKSIEYNAPVAYQANVGTIKKAKYVTKHMTHASNIVFEAAPKPYNSYPVVEPMSASNYVELGKKVAEYVDDLVNRINAPLKECPHCLGTGAVSL